VVASGHLADAPSTQFHNMGCPVTVSTVGEDGSLLFTQGKTEGGGFGGFVIVAPHAWTGVKAPFDFTK
jgi:hypothetical protein